MKKLFLSLSILLVAVTAMTCWFTEENYARNYIAAVNTQLTFYSDATWSGGGIPACPDDITISLPATVWVVLAPRIGQPAIQTATLQYKRLPSGSWETVKTLTSLSWAINFTSKIKLFGKNVLDPPGLSSGDSFLIRLYVNDGLFENAPLANDTDEHGTNSWQDQWVVKCTWNGNRRSK